MTAWRVILVVLALALGWQALSLNVADHYVAKAKAGDVEAIDAALWWEEHPEALAIRARDLLIDDIDSNDAEAVALLRRSVALAPTGARQIANLAQLAQAAEREDAVALARIADRLDPVDWRVQRALFLVETRRGAYAEGIGHLARALVGNPALADQYFPVLLQAAASEESRALLAPLTDDPSPYRWWNGFFRYAARESESVAPLRGLVALREDASGLPLQPYERDLYVARLRRDGLIKEAYLYWVNGLTPEQLDALGYVYDGGFEHAFANDAGFGWSARAPRNSGIRITRGNTYGASGSQALRLAFRGRRVRFDDVWQHLFLGPGSYDVSGRVRPDQLRARRGLQWRLYCSSGEGGTLGESELFSGTGDWREFDFVVTVPPGCSGQTLRLYSAGNRIVDHEVSGTVWFDDLRIALTP